MTRTICLILLAATLALGREAVAETQPPDGLVTCLAADARHEPIWPTRSFPVSGKQLFCVFRLGDDESFAKLTQKWIAVDVGDAAPANTLITEGDLDLKGQKAGRLRYSQTGPLPVGKYRLEVLADGKPWKTAEFTVAPDPKPLEVAKPQDLLTLVEGKTWRYDFVQEAGPGVKLSAPGETLDPDGKLRATVTLAVGKTDKTGTEVVIRRNGKTVIREWWTLGPKGLSATQRQVGDDVTSLDPPQPLLPVSRDSYTAWTYKPKDGAFTQAGQVWASLPVDGPSGEAPGYLTVLEQATELGKVSVERHLLPGVGLVREVTTSTVGPKLLSRQVMTLAPPAPEPK